MTYFIKKSTSKTRIINGSFDSIPWDQADEIYTKASQQAQKDILGAANRAAYQQHQKSQQQYEKLFKYQHPESGSYEGSTEEDFVPIKLTDLDPKMLQDEKTKAAAAALETQFVKAYIQKSWSVDLMAQVVHKLSEHKLNSAGVDGTIEGQQYLRDNFDVNNASDRGLYRFLMMDARGSYLEKQGTGEAKAFCTLVPLILYAHKLYNKVPYTRWERESLQWVVNPALCEAMLTEIPDFEDSRLLEIRELALKTTKDGKPVARSAMSTYMLYRTNTTELKEYNLITQHMMLQTWAAHPSNRTKYMVLDPMNWDTIPAPLVDSNIFKGSSGALTTKQDFDPWNLPEPTKEELEVILPWNA